MTLFEMAATITACDTALMVGQIDDPEVRARVLKHFSDTVARYVIFDKTAGAAVLRQFGPVRQIVDGDPINKEGELVRRMP